MHGGDIYRNQVTLDFSVNVNLLGVPNRVKEALHQAVEDCHCYPDMEQEELIKAIAGWTGANPKDIVCGNGASELFPAIVRALKPQSIVIPVPSFYGYERAANSFDAAQIFYYELKEADGFCLSEAFLDVLTEQVDVVFLANPNNPVGNLIPHELLCRILVRCREQNIFVVLDECFIEFTRQKETASFWNRIHEFPNLFVVRAFTKLFAIPGVRLGYMACVDPVWRRAVRMQLSEWNLSVFAQKAGVAATKETEYIQETMLQCTARRSELQRELQMLGFRVYPSEANYLLLYTDRPLAKELLAHGILIRDCSNYRGLRDGYYRVAVRSREENEALLAAIRKLSAAE